jgi:hypothetical protein
VLFYVFFVCKCVPPRGDNPTAVNKYINNRREKHLKIRTVFRNIIRLQTVLEINKISFLGLDEGQVLVLQLAVSQSSYVKYGCIVTAV